MENQNTNGLLDDESSFIGPLMVVGVVVVVVLLVMGLFMPSTDWIF
jgi:type II secretory pathway component PulF